MEYKEIPGNARGSTIAYQQQLMRLAQQFIRFEHVAQRMFEDDKEVYGLSVRVPTEEGADYLVTVRARIGNDRMVAFHTSDTFSEVMRGTVARLENGSMRWKVDMYDGK